MVLGISPVEDLKKKVDLLSSKIETLSSTSSEGLMQRIEEVEDLQLLEKLNSIEMREEIQNIRTELENIGGKPVQSKSSQTSDVEDRIRDLETKLQEVEILSAGASGKADKIDWDAIKEDIIEEVQKKIKPVTVSQGSNIDVSEIEENILHKLEGKFASNSDSSSQPMPQVDTKEIEDRILSKVDDRIRSLKPGMFSGMFSKQSMPDVKFDPTELKIAVKSDVLSDLRTIVNQEVDSRLSEMPTVPVSKSDLKLKLAQLKTDIIETINVEKAIDKKLVPVIKTFEGLENRFAKNDSQLTTLFSTLPREIKLVKDDMNMRLESQERGLDQLRREVKEVRLGGIEGYQYLVTKEEARRVADEKVNVLRNEIMANKLAGDDEKYTEALNRVMGLDDRFSLFKAEVLPAIERMSELDRLSGKLADIEDHLSSNVHDKLAALDPVLIRTLVATVDQLRERIDVMDREPSEFVKRSLDSLRLAQDRDRENSERIAQFVHLETERMANINDDIKSTVETRLEAFEKRIPPEEVWIEIEALRSRLAALERTNKEMSMQRRSSVRPAIIE